MAEKNNANIGFEKQIWDAACVLWGHIPAAEYRKVIIGLIFLRYISSAFEKRYNELVAEGEGFEEDRDEYLGENVFFVPEKARWSTIASAAHSFHSIINALLLKKQHFRIASSFHFSFKQHKTAEGLCPPLLCVSCMCYMYISCIRTLIQSASLHIPISGA